MKNIMSRLMGFSINNAIHIRVTTLCLIYFFSCITPLFYSFISSNEPRKKSSFFKKKIRGRSMKIFIKKKILSLTGSFCSLVSSYEPIMYNIFFHILT